MKRNFTNENFESFLQQNADGLKLHPSDKVWKGISRHLNRKRRRFGLLMTVFLLTISTASYFIIDGTFGNSITGTRPPVQQNTEKSSSSSSGNFDVQVQRSNPDITSVNPEVSGNNSTNKVLLANPLAENFALTEFELEDETSSEMDNGTELSNDFMAIIADSDPFRVQSTSTEDQLSVNNPEWPYSKESVMNSYRPRKRKSLEWQLFFTPTVSYRKLGENKSYLHKQQYNFAPAPAYDVNNVVTHKPDLGFQLGLVGKYPVTKKLKVLTGLQFNITRYDIKAFSSPTSYATIRLNTASNADSVTSQTTYNNFNGYRSNWLENLYFQVSAPIGVEYKIRGDERMQLGVATSIQPTYILGDRAYLISTDYKNYAQVPDLIRRWNVNTTLETYVGYSTGQVKWQVGPQVRYQLLSSFVDKYPVKENLFDFGLKVGISLNNQ